MSKADDLWIPPQVAERDRQEARENKGWHVDGSLTLCPEAYKQLVSIFNNFDNDNSEYGVCLPMATKERVAELRRILYEIQGIEFESYT